MLESESEGKDSRYGNWLVAGQRVQMGRVLSALRLPPCVVPHGEGGAIVAGTGLFPSYWGAFRGELEFFRSCGVKEHFPLTLKEADALLLALNAITPEHVHHALDAALLV